MRQLIVCVLLVAACTDYDRECRESCDYSGQCSGAPRGGCNSFSRVSDCKATNGMDCVQSIGCRMGGACSIRDGKCVVLSDADCQRAEACSRYHSHCRAVPSGQIEPYGMTCAD